MNDIKAAIFDYDDTLVDSLKAKWAQHKFVAKKEYGKDLSDEEILLNWTKPYSELVMALYDDNDKNRAIENNKRHEVEFPKRLLPETIQTLEYLHRRNILTGVVTSTSLSSLQNDLKRFNFPVDLLDYTQAEDATIFHKPDPRVFEPFMNWLAAKNIQKQQVLYMGDGLHDMEAATSAGFNFIGITTGLITAQTFEEHGSKHIESLLELIALIR